MTTTTTTSTTKPAAKPAAKPIKVGAFAVGLMLKGKDNSAVLKAIKAKFPKAKTSENAVNWYRSNARREGLKIAKNSEL